MECEVACCTSNSYPGRNFLTKSEKIEMLKEYHTALTKEVQGVKERIEALEKKDE